MNFFAPKVEERFDPNTGLKNYALVWYGRELQTGINDMITQVVRATLPKALMEDGSFQEKVATELKKAIESMQAEVLISIIKAAVREAMKEEKV
jgi:hypothetical protein